MMVPGVCRVLDFRDVAFRILGFRVLELRDSRLNVEGFVVFVALKEPCSHDERPQAVQDISPTAEEAMDR